MDKSLENIKMLSKAEEIQDAWIPNIGDYCIHPSGAWGDIEGWVVTKYFDIVKKVEIFRGTATTTYSGSGWICKNVESFLKPDCTWLPRQDQFQDMMLYLLGDDFIGCAPFVLNEMLSEHSEHGIYMWGRSYEEMWLRFVMKEKYNKIWDGEEWM